MIDSSEPLPPGLIDIHSHLLPGIDDGCPDAVESLACVERLIARGFVGTICTPHVWNELFPQNVPTHIQAHTRRLQRQIDDVGLSYRLWPGAEVRLYDGIIDWFKAQGVPTLADSRCVLADFWDLKWPGWSVEVFDWLLEHDYQPVLAHPERLPCVDNLDKNLDELVRRGVWLQGNAQCMTGEEGYHADHVIRRLLNAGRYKFIALDMHRLESLASRLDGLDLIEQEYDRQTLDRLTAHAPRELILHEPSATR